MATADLSFDVSALDRASRTFANMANAVDRFERRLEALDGKKVTAEADVKTDKAEREVGRFARDLQRRIGDAVKSLPEIQIDADSSDAQRELAAVRADLVALGDKRIGIDLDAAQAQRQAADLQGRLTRLAASSTDVQIRADAAAAVRDLAVVSGQVDELNRKTATVKVKVDRGLSESIVQVAALGRALGALAVPVALAAAVPQLAGLGAAAVSASGALLLIPAAGAAAAAGVATLVVGLQGLGEALKNRDDPAKFAEALKELAPAGREFATAVRDIGPAWKTVQLDVQQRLLAGLGQELAKLSGTYLPTVQQGLAGVATALNTGARDFASWARFPSVVADVGRVFTNTAKAAERFAPVVLNISEILLDLSAVGSDFLPGLADGFAAATDSAAAFMDQARKSGDLAAWMQRGIDTVKQLGRILSDVGASLLNVFSAADAAGVSFLGTVERITQGIRDFTSSAEGQQTIVAVFTGLREIVDAVWPGIERLAVAVGNVVQRLQDAGVFRLAGEAFTAIAEAAAPLIENLGALAANVLPPLLSALKALAPVLVPVAAGMLAINAASKGASAISAFATGLLGVGKGADDAKTKGGGLPAIFGNIGKSADDADKKTRKLGTGLKLLAIPAGLAAGGAALSAIGDAAETSGGKVDIFRDQINDLGPAMQQAASFDFVGIFSEVGSELDQMVRDFETGTSAAGRHWSELVRYVTGFEMKPVNIEVNANVAQATAAAENLLGQIDGSGAEITVNGNTLPAGTALQQVLADVAAGKAIIDINGNPMPANEALQYVIGLVNNGAGMVDINGNPTPAGQALADVLGQVNGAHAMLSINGNSMPAGAALQKVIGEINAGVGFVTVDGHPMKAEAALAAVLAKIDISQAQVTIDGQAQPAQAVLDAYLAAVNSGSATVKINGTDVPARDVLNAFLSMANTSTSTSSHNLNITPAQGSLGAFAATANGTATISTHNANTAPASGSLNSFAGQANGTRTTSTHNANITPAQGSVGAFASRANATVTTSNHNANTAAAQAAINRLKAPTSSTHTVHIRTVGGTAGAGGSASGSARVRAAGAYAMPAFMAAGGLRRMSAARAEIVPPRQPRIIGDRMQGREAFIPINRSARSRSILHMAARDMGFDVVQRARTAAAGASERIRLVSAAGSADRMTVLAQQSGQAQQVLLQLEPVVAQLRALQAAVRGSVPSNLDVVDELRALQGAVLSLRRAPAAGEARGARLTAELGATW